MDPVVLVGLQVTHLLASIRNEPCIASTEFEDVLEIRSCYLFPLYLQVFGLCFDGVSSFSQGCH